MLKNVIAGTTLVCFASIVFANMTTFAHADDSVATKTESYDVEVEMITDEAEFSAEASNGTIRSDSSKSTVNVRDVIYFDNGIELTDTSGRAVRAGKGEHIYVVDIEADERYRVYLPKANMALYVDIADVQNAEIVSHDGLIIGDLNCDGKVDSYDLVVMKHALIFGWGDTRAYHMSDMNADGNVSIGDLVFIERRLLGAG